MDLVVSGLREASAPRGLVKERRRPWGGMLGRRADLGLELCFCPCLAWGAGQASSPVRRGDGRPSLSCCERLGGGRLGDHCCCHWGVTNLEGLLMVQMEKKPPHSLTFLPLCPGWGFGAGLSHSFREPVPPDSAPQALPPPPQGCRLARAAPLCLWLVLAREAFIRSGVSAAGLSETLISLKPHGWPRRKEAASRCFVVGETRTRHH